MVRSILVPLDGQSSSEEALPAAAALAVALGARLLLVRPVSPRVSPAVAPSAACRAAETHAYLQDRAADVHVRAPFLHVGVSAPYGPWPDAVLDEAALAGVELIVADRRLAGNGGNRSLALHGQQPGAAALALSRRAEVPLLLLPPHTAGTALVPPPGSERHRLLVPLDGSPAAEAILPVIARLGATLPLCATVLHVLPPRGLPIIVHQRLFSATASHYCERVAAWLERHGIPSAVEIRVGSPVEEIGRAALDLVGTRGDALALGLPEALPWRFGYGAEPLLRATALPVLQLRSRRSAPVVPADVGNDRALDVRSATPIAALAGLVGEWDYGAHASSFARGRL